MIPKGILDRIKLDAETFSVVNQDGEVIYGESASPTCLATVPRLFFSNDGSYVVEKINDDRYLIFKGKQVEDTKTFFCSKLRKYGIVSRLILTFKVASTEI